jgi:alkylation response protein AidB-like acyl-CoA dehydrogenase
MNTVTDIQFQFTDEHQQFRESLRRFLKDTSAVTSVRSLMETESGYDQQVWQRLNGELGLQGLIVPEQYGGSGFGMMEMGIAMEEMGRALYCGPFFSSAVMAVAAIDLIASEDQKLRWLPQIASGDIIGALAVAETSDSDLLRSVQTCVAVGADDEGYRLTGNKRFVVSGCQADLLLVVARLPGTSGLAGLSLFAVSADASGLSRRGLSVMDRTRKQAELQLDQTPAELIGHYGQSGRKLQMVLDLAAIALANEMVGGAEKLLQDTLDYTQLRVQFGRAIGSFQAIKHRCTDLLLAVELAKSAAYFAAESAGRDTGTLAVNASIAKAEASEVYLLAALETIQLHGGIGFTWENDTHLWFKRAKSSEVLLGDPVWHRARLVNELVSESGGQL